MNSWTVNDYTLFYSRASPPGEGLRGPAPSLQKRGDRPPARTEKFSPVNLHYLQNIFIIAQGVYSGFQASFHARKKNFDNSKIFYGFSRAFGAPNITNIFGPVRLWRISICPNFSRLIKYLSFRRRQAWIEKMLPFKRAFSSAVICMVYVSGFLGGLVTFIWWLRDLNPAVPVPSD